MMLSPTQFSLLAPTAILLESWRDVAGRIWHYLDDPYHIGSVDVSITRLIEGILIFALAILASRTLSALLQRRIAKRAYLDPGLRYTMGRLTQYLIVTIGLLLSLKAAFSLDLTSIAVLFTALSVGIGFGLHYIAADVASGLILLFARPVRGGDGITIWVGEGG